MKILVDSKIKFLDGAFPFAEVHAMEGKKITSADLADVDALLIRTRTKCNDELLRGTPVKAIFTATIGFDHIDVDYCQNHNIHWENAPGCNAASVQQYVFSALATLRRNHNIPLKNKTIAIIGVGNVGRKIEHWATALGMNVLRVDPLRAEAEDPAEFLDYYDALSVADIVTFHVPLTYTGKYKTYHLFDEVALQRMKQGAILINTSRGEVVDTQVLKRALREKRISHSIIDVWENEPHIDVELIQLSTIATPHIAGYSADSKLNATRMAVDALCRHFGKENTWTAPNLPQPPNQVLSIDPTLDEISSACEMFLQAYDISFDDKALRNDVNNFESLRGNYWTRREIGAFELPVNAPHAEFLHKFGIR